MGLKINESKGVLIRINLREYNRVHVHVKIIFNVPWASSSIKYLGLPLPDKGLRVKLAMCYSEDGRQVIRVEKQNTFCCWQMDVI